MMLIALIHKSLSYLSFVGGEGGGEGEGERSVNERGRKQRRATE